ncbi:RdRP-domain-containing protein [Dentipellis sp. KUC8613]|nr:RdRP-domain-containing protein [Dentipellis sp. KUC8613]
MELELENVDRNASIYDVQRAIAAVLHGPDFYRPDATGPPSRQRVTNFKVELEPRPAGGVGNAGRGRLILPSRTIGKRLLNWIFQFDHMNEKNTIRVLRRNLKIYYSDKRVPPFLKQELEKAMFVPPEKAEEVDEIMHILDQPLQVGKVQFGAWYKPDLLPKTSRIFSIEYERDYITGSAAYLSVEYITRAIRIQLGERMTEEQSYSIVVRFSSINKMGIGFDDQECYICFDLLIPPTFEEKNFNDRPREGVERRKNKDRDRISALDHEHERITPYAYQLRVTLLNLDDLEQFESFCGIAGSLFSPRQLLSVQRWIRSLDWPSAFQVEAILCAGLLNPAELQDGILSHMIELYRTHGTDTSDILRHYTEALRTREPTESPIQCLKRVCDDAAAAGPPKLPPGHFWCYHVTVTPTRLLLEGPLPTPSNRVVRHFGPAAQEHFVRVEFRDEDLGPFRWDRRVDGTHLLRTRIGTLLKDGFGLAGRVFEFLAYSASALRESSVWFLHPFMDPVEGYVTAKSVRDSLGDFSGVIKQPSKYAARIAQAFTATEPSVEITRDQWEEGVPDLGQPPYLHTDGVGTISTELGDIIWAELCRTKSGGRSNRLTPSAYQIRFLGYKGVVAVDERLTGIKMRLRPSMKKFMDLGVSKARIEIARSFEYPNKSYLNRPLIMAMEDRGVERSTFMNLQEAEKAKIYTAEDTLSDFHLLLRDHGLGRHFCLPFIIEQLNGLGLDFKAGKGRRMIKSSYFEKLVRYAQNHVLREVKTRARILVPNGYQLVGVADEGQAYINEGCNPDDVFTLGEAEIFACVQEAEKEPFWLEGQCVIFRNPVVHPGDLQKVRAVGKPPDGKLCFFRNLRNVVVLPGIGERSLASCLGGGDVDGDAFNIFFQSPELMPTLHIEPASYIGVGTRELPDGRESTIDDICDFVVEYINSDVLSLLCDTHLVIADQSKDGTQDERCMQLAELCSQAVDYPKNGIPVDMDSDSVPRKLIRPVPDWHKPEEDTHREADFYISDRALGHLFRNITLRDLNAASSVPDGPRRTFEDPIFVALKPLVRRTLQDAYQTPSGTSPLAEELFPRYAREMQYIRVAHSLEEAPGARLSEEEVVLGTILAKCVHKKLRSNRAQRMRIHSGMLVRDIHNRLVPRASAEDDAVDEGELKEGLKRAWEVWAWSILQDPARDAARSFGLVALGAVLDCLKRLGAIGQPAPAR